MNAAKHEITYATFEMIDIRAGTIISAQINRKAQKPAFAMQIDFGPQLGVKTTSAQITEAYDEAMLVGRQVLAVVNFPRKKIADIWSEVLVLGVVQDGKPTILIAPSDFVANGSPVL